jgi:hypothetical protein
MDMTDNKPIKDKLMGAFYLLKRGATFGAIAIFVVLTSFWFLLLPLGGFWQLDSSEAASFLIAAILGGLVVGLPAGGIGGLIVGSLWKHKIAAVIGGIGLALVLLISAFFLVPCPFLGGC